MNQASDYIKECPHGFPECSLCGKVSNSEQKILEHVQQEHMNRPEPNQTSLQEVSSP